MKYFKQLLCIIFLLISIMANAAISLDESEKGSSGALLNEPKNKLSLSFLNKLDKVTPYQPLYQISSDQLAELSPWYFDLGPSYWSGTGRYAVNLKSPSGVSVSKLTYEHLFHHVAEGYWKLQHRNGIYLKGYLGGGSLPGGYAKDEDFPPTVIPYSRTLSTQRYGSLEYFSADLGYYFFKRPRNSLSFFLGYHYWKERFNGFGCQQVGEGDPCAEIAEPPTQNGLDEVPIWNALRLGLYGYQRLFEPLSVIVDIAYLRSNLSATNYHNARPDIRGYVETGAGNGLLWDCMLNWELTPNWDVGLGGRWWYVMAKGFAHLEQTIASVQPEPVSISENRYGFLLRTNYRFEGKDNVLSNNLSASSHESWPTMYAGVNIGYGTNQNESNILPTSQSSKNLTFNYEASPTGLNIQEAGFIVGGQIGYNWYRESTLIGLEGDLDYAHVGGSQGSGSNAIEEEIIITNVDKNNESIATVRLKLGQFASEGILAYLTAGSAFGRNKLAFNQEQFGINCPNGTVCAVASKTQVKSGWTVGGGIEFAISGQCTMKAEYLYIDLGGFSTDVAGVNGIGSAVNYKVKSNFRYNNLRMGINYKIA